MGCSQSAQSADAYPATDAAVKTTDVKPTTAPAAAPKHNPYMLALGIR